MLIERKLYYYIEKTLVSNLNHSRRKAENVFIWMKCECRYPPLGIWAKKRDNYHEEMNLKNFENWFGKMHYIKTVSYTHLDVYKRQIFSTGWKLHLNMILFLIHIRLCLKNCNIIKIKVTHDVMFQIYNIENINIHSIHSLEHSLFDTCLHYFKLMGYY